MLISNQCLLSSPAAKLGYCRNFYYLSKQQQKLQLCLRLFQTTSIKKSENVPDVANFAHEWKHAKPFEAIPTMGPLTLIKNFLPGGKYAKMDTTQLLMAWRDDLGPLARMKGAFGRPDAVITHNPQDFEIVLHNEGIWPQRPGSDGLCYHRSVHRADFFQGVEGLIGTQGEQWGNFRTVVNPIVMNPKNVRVYLTKMSQVNKEFIERIHQIRDPETFEVPDTFLEELNRWTFESISVVALDRQLGLITKNRDNPDAKRMFELLSEFFTDGMDIEYKPPIWKYYKTTIFKKYMKTLDGITEIAHKYVNEAIERIEKQSQNTESETGTLNEKSVLEKLIKIDKKIATVMAMDMLMAGVDTTSSALAGALLCLAKNPEKQSKLRDEIMQVLPLKTSEFDEDTFRKLPYLRACIKESLRVYPVILGNVRLAGKDMVLSGHRVPKGTQVSMINLTLLNNDAHYPRAKEFLPERWLRSNHETANECRHDLKGSSPFIYLPFGFGPRSCVGRRIVEMELELGLARLVRNFHIDFKYSTDNAFKSLLINVPNIPLKFKFTDVEDKMK